MMVNKSENIYLIPITDNAIYIEGVSLFDYLTEFYPELGKLEDERVRIIYSSPVLHESTEQRIIREDRYREHKKKMRQYANSISVPLSLIAIGNSNEVRELITNIKITSEYPSALSIRELTKDERAHFVIPEDYKQKVTNFLSHTSYNPKNEKIRYSISEYELEGNLREKIRLLFGGLKVNINFETEEEYVSKAANSKAVEASLLFIIKYNLTFADFSAVLKMRILNSKVNLSNAQSSFIDELDDILIKSKLLEESFGERVLRFIAKKEST